MLTHEIAGQPCVERSRQHFESFWGVDLEKEIRGLNAKYESEKGREDYTSDAGEGCSEVAPAGIEGQD
jgi:hypothetical protein